MPAHEDRVGIFVPLWAMEATGGDARDAMVLAQITWWLQPAQRDGHRRTLHVVERDGYLWLYLTDVDLASDVGMSRDQVLRARQSLRKRGLIEYQSRTVAKAKVTLVRPLSLDDQSAESHNAKREVAPSKARGRADQSAKSHNAPITERVENGGDREPSASVDAANPPKPTDDPLHRKAWELAVLAFEQPEKPVLRSNGDAFSAVMKLVASLLHGGKAVNDIEDAIRDGVEVWTLAGLQTAVAQARQRRRGRQGRSAGVTSVLDELTRAAGGSE